LVQEDEPIFARVDTLIHKPFIFHHEEKTYAEVYIF